MIHRIVDSVRLNSIWNAVRAKLNRRWPSEASHDIMKGATA